MGGGLVVMANLWLTARTRAPSCGGTDRAARPFVEARRWSCVFGAPFNHSTSRRVRPGKGPVSSASRGDGCFDWTSGARQKQGCSFLNPNSRQFSSACYILPLLLYSQRYPERTARIPLGRRRQGYPTLANDRIAFLRRKQWRQDGTVLHPEAEAGDSGGRFRRLRVIVWRRKSARQAG